MSTTSATAAPKRIQVLETPEFARYTITPPGIRGVGRELGWTVLGLFIGLWLIWGLSGIEDKWWALLVAGACFGIVLSLHRALIIIIHANSANATIVVDRQSLTISCSNWTGDTRFRWSHGEIAEVLPKQRYDPRSMILPLVFAGSPGGISGIRSSVLVIRTHSGEETVSLAGQRLEKDEVSWLASQLRDGHLLGLSA